MALVFMEGWEVYDSTSDISRDTRCTALGGSVASSTTTRYTGGRSVVCTSNSTTLRYLFDTEIAGGATWFCGVAIYIQSFHTVTYPMIEWLYGGTSSVKNCIRAEATTGDLLFCRGASTTIHELSGTEGFSSGQWVYWVFKVKDDATTGTLEIWRNGLKIADETGLNTGNGTDNITGIEFRAGFSRSSYYDDCYVGDTTGSDLTDQVGEVRMEVLEPDANGTTNNFTASPAVANYLNVDEGPNSDDDTTYNYSQTVADKELYGTASLSAGTSFENVYAVQVHAVAKKSNTADRTANLICRSSTTEVDSATFALTAGYQNFTQIYENDPNGGINWTETTANNAEIGFEIAT